MKHTFTGGGGGSFQGHAHAHGRSIALCRLGFGSALATVLVVSLIVSPKTAGD
jgi:hypothetical protein